MTSSYTLSSMRSLQPPRKPKKKSTGRTDAPTTTSRAVPVPPPIRSLATQRSFRNKIPSLRKKYNNVTSQAPSLAQQSMKSGTTLSYTTAPQSYQPGLSVANSQPSTVSFRSSNSSQASVGMDLPMSQLTCSQFSNESQNSCVSAPQLFQNSASTESSSVSPQDGLYNTVVEGSMNRVQPTPRRRPWMGSVAGSILRNTAAAARSVQMPPPSAKRSILPPMETQSGGLTVLDRTAHKEEDVSIAQGTVITTNENKPQNSLITDHFKVVASNVTSKGTNDMGPTQDSLLEQGEKHLEQKRKDLEKLFEENLKALFESKIRDLDKRIEQETTGALARLNAAATEGVASINRGMESFSKFVSDAKESFQSKFLETMAKKLLPSRYSQELVPSDAQRDSISSNSQESAGSTESEESSLVSSQVSSVPSTVRVASTKRPVPSTGKRKNAPKAQTATTSGKRTESMAVPTRSSKRPKVKTTSPKVTTSPVRNSKAYCVTPSTKSAGRAAPPVSISLSRRSSTKKRLATIGDSKKRPSQPANQGSTTVRGAKKARKSPRTVSDSQSSSSDESSNFVSPILSAMSKRRKEAAKGRRTYGSKRIRPVSTSLDDCFEFIEQESC